MKLKKTFITGFGISIAATCLATQASAWEMSQGDSKSFVYAKDEGGASIALTCSDSMGIQATVYLDGNDMDNLNVRAPGRLALRRVTLDTESTEPKSDRWAYIRSERTLVSTEAWQGRRIYNAIVTGSPVSMSVRRVGDYTLNLPPVDENFKTFSGTCL